MSARKSERMINLTICLLATKRFLPRDQIRSLVEGYHGLSDAAFERTFERDKDDLRAMGVPIEVGSNEAMFDDELGYRIPRQDFELPPIEFTPDELSALGVATRVWQQASVASTTASALAKLRAAGVDAHTDRLAALEPTLTAQEPAFDPLWEATLSRRRVSFDYRGGQRRRVEPWSVTWRKGRWYLLGLDRDRGEPRMFKLARIVGQPQVEGPRASYQVPTDVDLAETTRRLEPKEPDSVAVLAISGDHAPALRRRGRPLTQQEAQAVAPDLAEQWPAGYALWELPYAADGDLVGDIAAAGGDVLAVAPLELRVLVRQHLQAFLEAGETQ